MMSRSTDPTDQTVSELQALVSSSLQIREELAQTSAEVDKRGEDPGEESAPYLGSRAGSHQCPTGVRWAQ